MPIPIHSYIYIYIIIYIYIHDSLLDDAMLCNIMYMIHVIDHYITLCYSC